MKKPVSVVVHGGAGRLHRQNADRKIPYLREAVGRAWDVLMTGAPGLRGVEAALRVLEGCEYFNAGYGGYPNDHGIVLLDVGVMTGFREFVSILNLRKLKYPSSVAVDMLTPGTGLMTVWTHELMRSVETGPDPKKERYGLVETHEELVAPYVKSLIASRDAEVSAGHGTVGCVVRDVHGNLYAGTSTGGINLKVNGRIGDSPLIGSGVFADNEVCALSTTGHGESFMRSLFSGFVIADVRRELGRDRRCFEKDPELLKKILDAEMAEMARKAEGKGGGIIVVPPDGRAAWTFLADMVSIGIREGTADGLLVDDAFVACRDGGVLRERCGA